MSDHEAPRRGWVYCLVHDREIRYVGLTVQPLEDRLYHHLWCARRGIKHHVCGWIRKVNYQVSIQPLVQLQDDELDAAEVSWIEYLREIGCDLTNMTDGGRDNSEPRRWREPVVRASCVHCRNLLRGPKEVARGCKNKKCTGTPREPLPIATCLCCRHVFTSGGLALHQRPVTNETRARLRAAHARRKAKKSSELFVEEYVHESRDVVLLTRSGEVDNLTEVTKGQ